MDYKLTLLSLFALFGVFLLGGGITSFVISESCCFGPDCEPENLCPTIGAVTEIPSEMSSEDNTALSFVGLLIIIVSVGMIFGYLRRKVREETKPNP